MRAVRLIHGRKTSTMPHTKCKTVYYFNELTDNAKDKARDWYREGALDYDWWEYTYEDAERCGLKITEFDLDRHRHVKGSLILSVEDSMEAILKDHGETCATFIMAKEFQRGLVLLDKDGADYEEEHETLEAEYLEALCEEYASLLQAEYEYLLSDESVDEMIIANEYEFTEGGKRAC